MPNYIRLKQILIFIAMFFVIGGQTTVSTVQDETSNHISAARAFVEMLKTENFKAAVAQFDDTMKAAHADRRAPTVRILMEYCVEDIAAWIGTIRG